MTAMTDDTLPATPRTIRDEMIAFGIMTALLLIVPLTGVYPFFVMQALCFALLACAFNLLIGYGGLLSFGHAMFLGTAGYIIGACAESLGAYAGTWNSDRHRGRRRTWRHHRRSSPSGARASTSR